MAVFRVERIKDYTVMSMPGDPQRSRKMAALFAEASFMAHRGTFATYTGKTDRKSVV